MLALFSATLSLQATLTFSLLVFSTAFIIHQLAGASVLTELQCANTFTNGAFPPEGAGRFSLQRCGTGCHRQKVGVTRTELYRAVLVSQYSVGVLRCLKGCQQVWATRRLLIGQQNCTSGRQEEKRHQLPQRASPGLGNQWSCRQWITVK